MIKFSIQLGFWHLPYCFFFFLENLIFNFSPKYSNMCWFYNFKKLDFTHHYVYSGAKRRNFFEVLGVFFFIFKVAFYPTVSVFGYFFTPPHNQFDIPVIYDYSPLLQTNARVGRAPKKFPLGRKVLFKKTDSRAENYGQNVFL